MAPSGHGAKVGESFCLQGKLEDESVNAHGQGPDDFLSQMCALFFKTPPHMNYLTDFVLDLDVHHVYF